MRPSLAAMIIACCLGACAPATTNFDANAHPNIRRIALLDIAEPPQYEIGDTSGNLFGVVGMAIVGSIAQSRAERLTAAIHDQHLELGASLGDALEAKLRAHGYDVVRLTVPHPKPHALLEDYGTVQTDADAILDVAFFSVGFVTAPLRNYMPLEAVYVRMVTVPDHKVVYADHPAYSTMFTATIHPRDKTAKDTFGSFDEMMAAPDAVAAVWRRSTEPTADYIAAALGAPSVASLSKADAGTPRQDSAQHSP
jgi:hypothetical protein